jgi:hypothetical protein
LNVRDEAEKKALERTEQAIRTAQRVFVVEKSYGKYSPIYPNYVHLPSLTLSRGHQT